MKEDVLLRIIKIPSLLGEFSVYRASTSIQIVY